MQIDPVLEGRRLSEHYRAMSDEELLGLAADFADLTDAAQNALRTELQCRHIADANALASPPSQSALFTAATVHREPLPGPLHPIAAAGLMGRTPELIPDDPGSTEETGEHEYTWKTVLCECETNEEARQLSEVLRQSGIDSWIEQPYEFGRRYPRVLVAADQFDRARAISAQPIPQGVIDDSEIEIPEFVAPVCPKCGAEDPVLESADPVNTWSCEQCDEKWSDPPQSGDATPG